MVNIDKNAYIVYTVGMKSIQYTIRNIPEPVDRVIRKQAKRTGKSFNATVVELLKMQTLPPNELDIFEEMRGAGTLDQGFFDAIEEQSRVDPSIWD